ncbi:glucose-6-phosphate isomerase [Gammaproteobacteria bacterium]|nr:glucose-6-phosphate isomerase [Gammaproteobacteria bacterium]
MTDIKLKIDKAFDFVSKDAVKAYEAAIAKSNATLHNGDGAGNDFLGWLNLPTGIDEAQIADLQATAEVLRKDCEVVVVVGIGGSYLGAKAVIEALNNSFDWLQTERKSPVVVYAGQNIGEDYLAELQEMLKTKKFGIIVISKSGTTTEPALAFRMLKTQLEAQQGKEAAQKLIVAITDKSRGALRTLATQEGYKTFVIEDNVGGRFSVLTPVGLLPVAVAGHDIAALVKGAQRMEEVCGLDTPFEENPAAQYAAVRNALYADGKKIEILVNYNPKLHYVSEWWKQLYGESEGKDGKGIFPAAVDFTTDLHSMGQWIQDGERTIFETVITVLGSENEVRVPLDEANLDGLNYLAGKRIDEVNKMAELGTMLAHMDGGVPNLKIELPKLDAYYLGQLLYFFEKGCGISGYVLDVNPFNQPGVEAYKKNMFALLEKPGFEAETAAIKQRIK